MSWKLYLDAAGDTVGDTAGTGFGVAMGTTAASCKRHSNFTTETAAEMSKLPRHLFCLQPPCTDCQRLGTEYMRTLTLSVQNVPRC